MRILLFIILVIMTIGLLGIGYNVFACIYSFVMGVILGLFIKKRK